MSLPHVRNAYRARPRSAGVLRALLPLLLLLVVPLAAAQETLASLEEPRRGTDEVFPVTVTAEEAGRPHLIVFRNSPSSVFGVTVYDAQGKTVYAQNGTRGVQTLPNLTAGEYRFFLSRTGEFQVTDKAWEVYLQGDQQTTLRGTDAYVLAPQRPYNVSIEGNVTVEWWDLLGPSPETVGEGATREAKARGAYVLTVRGAEGTPYAIRLAPGVEAPGPTPTAEAPLPALVALGAAAVAVALKRRA